MMLWQVLDDVEREILAGFPVLIGIEDYVTCR